VIEKYTYNGRDKQTLNLVGKRIHQTPRLPVEAERDQDAVQDKQTQVQEEEGQPDAIQPL
jgi:hypothetical protein